MSEVIPHVTALKKYLDKTETEQRTPDLSHMQASLKAELETRFTSISQDSNYLIATYLDPRFKTNYLGMIEATKARQEILLEYLECLVKSLQVAVHVQHRLKRVEERRQSQLYLAKLMTHFGTALMK